MRLKSIELREFLSYQHQVVYDLEKPGLVLLEGRNRDNPAFEANGAGKSALWDAVAWCLFGETLRGVRGDEVRRRGATRETQVCVQLHHGASAYKIERMRGLGNGGLLVEKDGVNQTQGTTVLTQRWIEQELGIDLELFRCTTVFAQGETFNFVEATDKQQKAILARIMRLNLEAPHDRAKQRAEKVQVEVDRLQVGVAAFRGKVDPARLEDMATEMAAWDAERDRRLEVARMAFDAATMRVVEGEARLAPLVELEAARVKLVERQTREVAEVGTQLTVVTGLQRDRIEANALRAILDPVRVEKLGKDVRVWYDVRDQRMIVVHESLTAARARVTEAEVAIGHIVEVEHAREQVIERLAREKAAVVVSTDVLRRLETERAVLEDTLARMVQVEGRATCPTCLQPVDAAHLAEEGERIRLRVNGYMAEVLAVQTQEGEEQARLVATTEQRIALDVKLRDLQDLRDTRLPTLRELAEAAERMREAVETEINPLVETYQAAQDQQREAEAKIAALEGGPRDAEIQAQACLDALNLTLKATVARVQVVDEKLRDLKNVRDVQLPFLREAVTVAGQVRDQVCAEVNPLKASYLVEKDQQQIAVAKIAELEAKIREQVGALAYLEFWVQGFGDQGLPSYVFDLVCVSLTAQANHYASLLTGGAVTIAFTTQRKLKSGETRERFDCEVLVDGKKVSYDAYSGGEKRRISLAVDLALSDLMVDHYGSDFSLVVYDEQDQYMDGVGRQHYLRLLKEIATKKRVFVVAHDALFKSMFEHTWTIEKQGGISRLAEVT